ncbi:MAG: HD domain-containing protein [Alphaproteobacteria bacterium]
MAAVGKSTPPLRDEIEGRARGREDVRARSENPAWVVHEGTSFEALSRADWAIHERQERLWYEGRHTAEMLALLRHQKDETTYGFAVNNYGHSLQTATRALRDGADEETVIVALFHDIGQTLAPHNHGALGATLLRPFVSPESHWLIEHHPVFQLYHRINHPNSDRLERDRYRGHPAFEATARFCERWDQPSFDPNYPTLPLAAFEPLVHRFFAREPRFTDPM